MNHISWNTTKRCNLYCKHCYRECGPNELDSDELSTKEGKTLLEEIYKAGFRIIVFSGGEPLMRNDIFELIEYASSLGMTTLMGSNGTLITKECAEKLKNYGLKSIAISIDSLNPIKHNNFRGSSTAFQKALEGAQNCIDVGINVQINCTITKENLNELDKIMNFASTFGASSCHMLFLVQVGRGKNLGETYLNKDEYKKAIHTIIDKNLDIRIKPTCAPQYKVESLLKGIKSYGGIRGCIAGISYCSILPNGDIHICPYAPVKVASVREESFDSIWHNNDIFCKLRDFKNYKGKCGNCKYINICGGCRARAFNHSGDWLDEDPYCLL
ncbi:radical SAM/SPASM domain-containing protein [Clostridium brassicae]|uniref:Radical SAM protein n=1 Tax=Clostridium brassicae TaxID=2999072 RepID=A0ABT4DFC4_9CLOT|nr:radical SAM protein [Clostridium brassicae]MCY6959806.1 radical SAM protein [Clostridium brassicae]